MQHFFPTQKDLRFLKVTARRFLFWVHLVGGTTIGLAIFFLAVTGSLMAFQTQIVAWAERSARVRPLAEAVSLPPSALANAARASQANAMPTNLTFFADKSRPVEIAFGQKQVLLLDPYSGKVLSAEAGRLRNFFITVRDLHRWLALNGAWRERARSIKAACCLLFLLQIITGLVLWIPRQLSWQHFRAVLWFRGKTRGRVREWNAHNVAGIWISLPAIAILLSGLIMAYPWATALLYRAAGTPPPPAVNRSAGSEDDNALKQRGSPDADEWKRIDAMTIRAIEQDPKWTSVSFRLPATEDKTVVFTVDEAGSLPAARSRLTLERKTARVVRWEPFSSNPRGRQWRQYARYIHTGEFLGLPGETIVFSTCLGIMLMVWTGFSLAWRRLAAWRAERESVPAPPSGVPSIG